MKRLFLILGFFFSFAMLANAQGDLRQNSGPGTGEKFSVSAGMTYDIVPVYYDDNVTQVFQSPPAYYGFGFRGNYVLLHSNDFVSLSAASGLNLNFQLTNLGFGAFLRLPIYALARIGNIATPFNTQSFGIGIGGGMSANYLRLPYSNFSGLSDRMSQVFFAPTAILEINWRGRLGNNGIQFYYNPVNAKGNLSSISVNPVAVRIGGVGIGIYYSF